SQLATSFPVTKFMPAGTTGQIAIEHEYKVGESWLVVGQRNDNPNGLPSVAKPQTVNASTIPEKHPLVTDSRVSKTATLITFEVPSDLSSTWDTAAFYLFNCTAAEPTPKFISYFSATTTFRELCIFLTVLFVLVVFIVCASIAFILHDNQAKRGGD